MAHTATIAGVMPEEHNPLKQGLRHLSLNSLINSFTPEEHNPLKQGLRQL